MTHLQLQSKLILFLYQWPSNKITTILFLLTVIVTTFNHFNLFWLILIIPFSISSSHLNIALISYRIQAIEIKTTKIWIHILHTNNNTNKNQLHLMRHIEVDFIVSSVQINNILLLIFFSWILCQTKWKGFNLKHSFSDKL